MRPPRFSKTCTGAHQNELLVSARIWEFLFVIRADALPYGEQRGLQTLGKLDTTAKVVGVKDFLYRLHRVTSNQSILNNLTEQVALRRRTANRGSAAP